MKFTHSRIVIAKRSQALVELIQLLGIKKKIFLSGTPIKNRASEYFIPLNLLDPLNFPSMDSFQNRFLQRNEQGKYARIDEYMLPTFKALTGQYIIRRERSQVAKDLPQFSRVFASCAIESERLKKLYNQQLDQLQDKQNEHARELSWREVQDNIIAMRRIVGMAKAEATCRPS